MTIYKDGGERRLASVLAELLASAVHAWSGWIGVVTHVPATERAQRRRGFDHAAEMSVALAAILGTPHVAALSRRRALDQRALGRDERFRNALGSFDVITPLCGNVLLVDDVLTTGATLDAAARALMEHGATEVRVATVSRAW